MTQSIGPPSLAQGTRIAVGFSTSISRFIPACGELSKPSWAIVQLDGSSPLARGTQDLDRLGYVADRFIPAYAGNSLDMCRSRCTFPVHPRLRGELRLQLPGGRLHNGSSPLTRGTHLHSQLHFSEGRFIPAYAGNSSIKRTKIALGTVHPRLRGELPIETPETLVVFGSSPLTRGTPNKYDIQTASIRFIPAYAGNSTDNKKSRKNEAVHPRLRGELCCSLSTFILISGSSPLTRGTLPCSAICSSISRFIPAYAGNSIYKSVHQNEAAVHPRLRGELQLIKKRIDNYAGSSPLTRGTRNDRQ